MRSHTAHGIESARPGDIVTLGRYPQTAAGADWTPIEWVVLENSGGELLVLSRHILDCRRYHEEFAETSWQDCDLRRWLNEEFYRSAFTEVEKGAIRLTRNADHGEGSPETEDRVFLLSEAEVERVTEKLGKNFRRARGTEFAKVEKADGCHLYVMDKKVDADYLTEGGKKYGCSWWWLRDRGRLKDKGTDAKRAVFVGTRASIRHYARVDLAGDGVRPAVRIVLLKRPK
jgi:hypothetical protein